MKSGNAVQIRKTSHRNAVKNPRARQLVLELRRQWNSIDKLKRAARLQELIDLGCSVRGLARDLGQKPTTVGSYVKLAWLSPEEQQELTAGLSQKKMLARKATEELQRKARLRIEEEQKTGVHSDKVADIIFEFRRVNGEEPKTPIPLRMMPEMLKGVRLITRNQLPYLPPTVIKVPHNISTRELFRLTQPPKGPGIPDVHQEIWLGNRERWLATILMSIVPEDLIRERAMSKVEERALRE